MFTTTINIQLMNFGNYPDIRKTYVAFHTTGFGEQGGEPIRRHEMVYTDDDLDHLITVCKALYPRDPSGWTYDDFSIDINLATQEGTRLYEKFREEWKVREQYIKDHPEKYETIQCDGYTITYEKNAAFDTPVQPLKFENLRMVFLDTGEDTNPSIVEKS